MAALRSLRANAPFVSVAILLGTALWIQAWLANLPALGVAQDPWEGKELRAYTEALAAGQPYLKQTPDARLAALSNPYARQNDGIERPVDISYYRGRFYSYFGIVPHVLIFVPWFVATGTHFSVPIAVWGFCAIGFLAYGLGTLTLWRRCRDDVSPPRALIALGLLAACSGTWTLLVRPVSYELLPAAAYGCLAVSLMSLLLAEARPRRRGGWLAFAGFAAALTMGCRPNYAPAVAIVSIWIAYRVWRDVGGLRARTIALLKIFSPLAAVGLLLAAFNYARFGNPLEFGFSYQFHSFLDRSKIDYADGRFLLFNLKRYLAALPGIDPYFPFIGSERPSSLATPKDYEFTTDVYGALWISPVLAFAGLLFFRRRDAISFATIGVIALVVAAGNLTLLSYLGFGAARYAPDFQGPLAFAAASALVTSKFAFARAQRAASLAALLVLLWSTIANWCLALTVQERFALVRPSDLAAVARPFDSVVEAARRVFGAAPRTLQLELSFPSDKWGKAEPIVVLGPRGAQDFLYAIYSGPGHLQLAFESMGYGGPPSQSVPIDYSKSHLLELRYGSFLPPDGDAYWKRASKADQELARKTITVLLDGKIVLQGPAVFHRPRGLTFIGHSPFDAAFGIAFTGAIHQVRRVPLPPWPKLVGW